MTINEAINYIDTRAKDLSFRGYHSEARALMLGIEALKRLYLQREHPKRKLNTLLSGETE